MPRWARRTSMSAIRCAVVFVATSVSTPTRGMLRPAPRWSNDPIPVGVEEATASGPAPRSGPTVQRDHCGTGRVARRLPIDRLAITDLEHARLVRLDLREELRHTVSLSEHARAAAAEFYDVTAFGSSTRW